MVFKDVPTEAMGRGLWTPHQLVIELSCDQSAVKGPHNRQNKYFHHKESVQYLTASPADSHFSYW